VTAITQEQEDRRHAEKAGLRTTKLQKTSAEIFNAIAEGWSNPANSADEEDCGNEEDNDNTIELGNMGEDDAAGWVMGTISKIGQQHISRFWLKQRRLDE
jgi:hypothetical protein